MIPAPIVLLATAAAETAPAQATSDNQIVIAVLGSASLGAIVAAVITGLFSKKKLGAEATEIITKAASGVVENLNGEILRVSGLLDTARKEIDSAEARHQDEMAERDRLHAKEMSDVRHVLQLHAAWDAVAVAKLGEYGIDLPEPPPLLPPPPLRRSHGG